MIILFVMQFWDNIYEITVTSIIDEYVNIMRVSIINTVLSSNFNIG
jgi:hypothetical protein